jgi:hypothetical protein
VRPLIKPIRAFFAWATKKARKGLMSGRVGSGASGFVTGCYHGSIRAEPLLDDFVNSSLRFSDEETKSNEEASGATLSLAVPSGGLPP